MPNTGEKITPAQARENSKVIYDKLKSLADKGIITDLELKANGNLGVTFKYKGQEFQVAPNNKENFEKTDIRKSLDAINARYDAELAALETTPVATSVSDIEAKKAELERQRKDVLKESTLMEANVGDVLYDREDNRYEVIGKKPNGAIEYKLVKANKDWNKDEKSVGNAILDKVNTDKKIFERLEKAIAGKNYNLIEGQSPSEFFASVYFEELKLDKKSKLVTELEKALGKPKTEQELTEFGTVNPREISLAKNAFATKLLSSKPSIELVDTLSNINEEIRQLEKIAENITSVNNPKNVRDILSSLNIDVEAEINRIKPGVNDTDTDINNKKC